MGRNWTLVHCHPTHPCRGRSTTAIQTPKAQTQLEFQLLADTCTLSHTLYFYCDTHACLRAASRSSTEGGRKCSPTFARWLSTMLMVARYPVPSRGASCASALCCPHCSLRWTTGAFHGGFDGFPFRNHPISSRHCLLRGRTK